jgi:hypothetical protein
MYKQYIFIVMVFITIIVLAPNNKLHASTIITNNITSNTTWDVGGSPYIITSPIDVALGVTLTIQPGVVIKSYGPDDPDDEDPPLLSIKGTLHAVGNAINPIVFTSYLDDSVSGDSNSDGSLTSPGHDDWGGIKIFNATSVLAFVDFSYAVNALYYHSVTASIDHISFNHNHRDIYADHATITGTNIDIADSVLGIFSGFTSQVYLTDCTEINTTTNAAIIAYDSSLSCTNCIFDTGKAGIRYYGLGTDITLDSVVIKNFSEIAIDNVSSEGGFKLLGPDDEILTMTNSQILNNAIGIRGTEHGVFSVHQSSFSGNTIAFIIGGTIPDLTNNWWGDPTGPYDELVNPTGQGDTADIQILSSFSPWLSTDPFAGSNGPSIDLLTQFKSDGSYSLAEGGLNTGDTIILKGTLHVPDGGMASMEVEIKPNDVVLTVLVY